MALGVAVALEAEEGLAEALTPRRLYSHAMERIRECSVGLEAMAGRVWQVSLRDEPAMRGAEAMRAPGAKFQVRFENSS